MTHTFRWILMSVLIGFGLPGSVAAAGHGDAIELRRAVRMPEGADALRLADIAILQGDAAKALGEVIIYHNPDPTSLQQVRRDEIRRHLEQAGAHWGSLHLSGGDVTVRPRASAGEFTPQAMQGASISQRSSRSVVPVPREHREDTLPAIGIIAEHTLRSAIAQRFVHALQIEPDDLRLTFDMRHEALLRASLDEHRFEIQPLSSFATDRVELAVREWKGGRVSAEHIMSVQPLIRTRLVEPQRDLRRGEPIVEFDLAERETWTSPAIARIHAARDEIIGKTSTRVIRQGEPIRQRDLQSEIVIRRGDRVTVRCVSGGLVITLLAEARGEGAVGDEVPLRKLGERDTFTAVIAASGEAVIDLTR